MESRWHRTPISMNTVMLECLKARAQSAGVSQNDYLRALVLIDLAGDGRLEGPPPWSLIEIGILRFGVSRGHDDALIARFLGRSREEVAAQRMARRRRAR